MKNKKEVSINLYNPTPPQQKALKVLWEDQPFITLLNFGRQVGKSYLAIMECIKIALKYPKTRVMFLTPTFGLSAKHIQTIQGIFEEFPDVMPIIFKDGQKGIKTKSQELHFTNGSIVLFRSAEMGDNLRGDTVKFVVVDEAAFIPKWIIMEVIMPMLTRTQGRMLIISTPNGRNWFYDMYNRGQKPENKDQVISVRADYRDLNDPDVNKVIAMMKQEMTSSQFAREVLGEFVSDEALFCNIEECIMPKKHKVDMKCNRYIGIDIGVVNDYTVLTCINEKDEVIDIDRFNLKEDKLTRGEYVQRIKDFIIKHDKYLISAYFEINNKAELFEELIEDPRMYKLYEFNTNATSKPIIVNALIKKFEAMAIKIPNYDVLIAELYAYSSVTNPITGRVQFKNVGESHDDTVASLAIASYCKDQESEGGVVEFI